MPTQMELLLTSDLHNKRPSAVTRIKNIQETTGDP